MRFRPSFSLRTLAIVLTLVCSWVATKKYAEHDDRTYRVDTEEFYPPNARSGRGYVQIKGVPTFTVNASWAPLPFVIVQDQTVYEHPADHGFDKSGTGVLLLDRRVYYLWAIGTKFKLFHYELPYEFNTPNDTAK